jgi:hypothetical protein
MGAMKKTLVMMIVVLAMIVVPFAMAGSSVLSGYGESSQPVAEVKGATAGQQAASSGPSTLPFTGTDLAVVVVAGIALVGVGFGLRKLGRQ